MSFDLVLDEPRATDKVEVHDGINFIADSKIIDNYGPFNLQSFKRGSQTYLTIEAANGTGGGGGGCDSCSSCG